MLTTKDIQKYCQPYLDANVEGCAAILTPPDKMDPYILSSENLAVTAGKAESNRYLFAMDSSEIWKRVRDQNQKLLAILHNHPLGCAAAPSSTDIREGSRFSWYLDSSGERRDILWLIYNGKDLRAFNINPYHLDPDVVRNSTGNAVHLIKLETIQWFEETPE